MTKFHVANDAAGLRLLLTAVRDWTITVDDAMAQFTDEALRGAPNPGTGVPAEGTNTPVQCGPERPVDKSGHLERTAVQPADALREGWFKCAQCGQEMKASVIVQHLAHHGIMPQIFSATVPANEGPGK